MKRSSIALYLAVVAICVIFFSFFGEGLPRFWFDDISHYEAAIGNSYASLLAQIADFTHKAYDERVTNYLLSKLYLDFFGENLYFYRLTKMLVVSFGICMLAALLLKEGVGKSVILPVFLVYITSPILFIGTIWIVVLGTWSLFAKVLAFFIFFMMYRSEGRGLRFYLLCLAFLAIMLFGVKFREDFTLAPFVILAFLLFRRPKPISLYLIVSAAIVIVFPYYIFSWGGGTASRFHWSNLSMFKVYFPQIAFFIPFFLYSAYSYVAGKVRLNDTIVFALIWVVFECAMVLIYPSDEMRYLESLLLSSVFFFAAFISAGFGKIHDRNLAVVIMLLMSLTGYRILENIKWDYNFRGSIGSIFIAVDKQMKFINEKYRDSLCLYSNFTLLYYEWKTTNHYVNLNPNNAAGRRFEEFYRLSLDGGGAVNVEFFNPEKYKHIFLLDRTLLSLAPTAEKTCIHFNGTADTFFERLQQIFKLRILKADLYDTKLTEEISYPVQKEIFMVR